MEFSSHDTSTGFTERLNSCRWRPKRLRNETNRHHFGTGAKEKTLELEDILKLLKNYDSYAGGINCSVCGKLYKSKVCLTKHLWEHSVYWDLFAGIKNHERVLSIQAAIILYSRSQGAGGDHGNGCQEPMAAATEEEGRALDSLLVTSPHKKDAGDTEATSSSKYHPEASGVKRKLSSPRKSPAKNRREASMENQPQERAMSRRRLKEKFHNCQYALEKTEVAFQARLSSVDLNAELPLHQSKCSRQC